MILPPNSIVASGPVIVRTMDGKLKTLLNRHKPTAEKPDPKWQFCGGKVEDFDASLETAARREAREEMGIDIRIIRPLSPMMVKRTDGSMVILIHYLADYDGDVHIGEEIAEYGWFALDELPENTASNVKPLLTEALTRRQ
mgnify:CR=1 FL=1